MSKRGKSKSLFLSECAERLRTKRVETFSGASPFLTLYISVAVSCKRLLYNVEPLPGVLGSRGAWAFIFRDIGRSSNYFQGLREPGFRFWGSREIKGTLIFLFFCSVLGLFTCRKAETDKCFSSLSIYKDNFHEGQLTSLTRAISSLCVMQCIMGKLKHMARHSQDGGRE